MFMFVYSSCHLNIQKLKYEYPKNLNTPQKSLLKSSNPPKILAKFSYQNKSQNWNFHTQKYPSIIPVTWSLEYSTAPPAPDPAGVLHPLTFSSFLN